MILRAFIILSILTTQLAFAVSEKKGMIRDFSEDETKFMKKSNSDFTKSGQQAVKAFKKKMDDGFQIEGKVFGGNIVAGRRTEAPGFMSLRQINPSAEVVGPIDPISIIRVDDTIYLRWIGTPAPQEGEVYATVTPALVMQDKEDPTSYEVGVPRDMNQLPERYQLAGYLYETSGWIRITKITQGLVEARVTSMRGQVAVGDRVMPTLPVFKEVAPVYGDGTLTATIVAGHPVERLSTTKGSYLYLNRGMRDGVRLGQMFVASEPVKLKNPIQENPRHFAGAVKVIYVSDAYSTGMISEQFDIIRIGSFLREQTIGEANAVRESSQQNFPNMEALPVSPENESLRIEEQSKSSPSGNGGAMSELDALENSIRSGGLTSAERDRLNQLQKQTEKKDQPQADDGINLPAAEDQNTTEDSKKPNDVPKIPTVENSFQKKDQEKKSKAKDKKKKTGKFRDEERLNEMMQ